VASPATVSRCGMVYMEQIHVGMTNLVKTWGATVLREMVGGKAAKGVVTTIEAHLEKAIDFIRYECKENVATSNNQLTAELLNLFEGQLRAEEDPKSLAQDSETVNALLVCMYPYIYIYIYIYI
jgi:hypothetical protein